MAPDSGGSNPLVHPMHKWRERLAAVIEMVLLTLFIGLCVVVLLWYR